MSDLKKELADIKVQRLQLWKEISDKEIKIELLIDQCNDYEKALRAIKKKIQYLIGD